MSNNLENLINLPLLEYYDENIKQYISVKIGEADKGSTVFVTDDNPQPPIGESGVLYVLPDKIQIWDSSKSQYVNVSAPQQDLLWDMF